MLKNFILFIALFSTFVINAQELPPIEFYDSKDYGAANQNWAISQSDDKYIYVANNEGLLEFNGAKWQLYNSPNESVLRSVKAVKDKIYTGSYMDFGYWIRNAYGKLSYSSLSKELNISLVEDEQFWNIISIDGYILFQSLDRIYLYNQNDASYKIINSQNTITKIFKVDGSIFYQSMNEGIYKIENGASRLITNDDVVKNNIIVNIFSSDDSLLIETQEQGFYRWKSNQLSKWLVASNDMVSNLSVYSSIQLRNGNFVLGTISNGMVYISKSGEYLYKIDQTTGLGNNTVLSLFEDKDEDIWLGLDNGINAINMNSPISIYNDKDGKLGTVYTSINFKGNLYLGTNQGLFVKDFDKKEDFTFINGTKGQVWCLVEEDDTLFCGHNNGTFIIKGNNAELIINTPGTWNIKSSPDYPHILFQGNYKGINILEKQNNQWFIKNKLEGFDISSRFFEIVGKNKIFVSHEYKGVYELTLNDDLTKVTSIIKDPQLEKSFNSSLIKYNNQILYGSEKGVFILDNQANRFNRDSILSSIFETNQYSSGKLIPDNAQNRLWGFSTKSLSYISPGKLSDKPKLTTIAITQAMRKEMAGYESISYLDDNKYLFGRTSGYIIIDLNKISTNTHTIFINTIANYSIDSKPTLIDKSKKLEFGDNENNMEFTYSVAEFDKYSETEYQYQLQGYYENWSDWSKEPKATFKNLPFGEYTFNVRARVGNILTENTASYTYIIKKPWYYTKLMVVTYILIALFLVLLTHNLYKVHYKKQRKKLLDKNKKEQELNQMESEQQLMQVENEKLQLDIDNKSRELAISTMSLIKKNEFLSKVKEELKGIEDSKVLRPVIKIIDNNINNTDDWKFFQEAFDNADKDFLKKVKSKHPSLTPNDLKLCAYLRLNLSSKEIAPLLNISPKSVEVKRYRLRKKIELPHDYSLTSYILEL
jgi:DNA-binding CsgD family transcriptional regulator